MGSGIPPELIAGPAFVGLGGAWLAGGSQLAANQEPVYEEAEWANMVLDDYAVGSTEVETVAAEAGVGVEELLDVILAMAIL